MTTTGLCWAALIFLGVAGVVLVWAAHTPTHHRKRPEGEQ